MDENSVGEAVQDPIAAMRESAMAAPNEALRLKMLEQAEALERQRLEEEAARAKRRVEAAIKTPFARMHDWMCYLPISWRQRAIVARVYSFQSTRDKDGNPHEFRMSLASGARELGIDRTNLKKDLGKLTEQGYLVKRSNGPRTPFSYSVNVLFCLTVAVANGYDEPWEETQHDDR